MNNSIEITRGDTLNITTQLLSDTEIDYTGFTSYMAIDFLTGITEVTGTTIDVDEYTTFIITSEMNNQPPCVYQYEVYITRPTSEHYTIIEDSYTILPSII